MPNGFLWLGTYNEPAEIKDPITERYQSMILKVIRPNEVTYQLHTVNHNCQHYKKIITEEEFNNFCTRIKEAKGDSEAIGAIQKEE